MTFAPKDRRGLGEIVGLSSATLAIGGVIAAKLFARQEIDPALMGLLVGIAGLLLARSTQGAGERSASSEMRTREALEMQRAAEEFKREAAALRQTASDIAHTLVANAIDRALPPPPLPLPKRDNE